MKYLTSGLEVQRHGARERKNKSNHTMSKNYEQVNLHLRLILIAHQEAQLYCGCMTLSYSTIMDLGYSFLPRPKTMVTLSSEPRHRANLNK